MKKITLVLALLVAQFVSTAPLYGQAGSENQILITNVRIFDGSNEELIHGNVLIEGNLVKEVAETSIAANSKAERIDGAGRTLMPGLIDVHQHLASVDSPANLKNNVDSMWIGAIAGVEAERMLMRGFTTVRDVGGPAIGLARAIDQGRVVGPRIYPSGPMISQTSGHGDFRNYTQRHPNMPGGSPDDFQRDYAILADGADEVLRATRENLRRGATQIKVMAGGGGGSQYDPLHTTQYTDEELRAAVQAAEDWGTYVLVHAYHDKSIGRALAAGVKSIEHGTLATDTGMKLIKRHDAWLVPQARLFTITEADVAYFESFGPESLAKVKFISENMDRSMALAVRHKVKIGFGTDLFGPPASFRKQNQEFEYRLKWFSAPEILRQATTNNAQILALSGDLNPYKEGPLGVVKPGAYADLLIVDGNPLEDIKVLGDPDNNLKMIMKDGVVYKNTL